MEIPKIFKVGQSINLWIYLSICNDMGREAIPVRPAARGRGRRVPSQTAAGGGEGGERVVTLGSVQALY